MSHALLTAACHAYAVAGVAFLVYLFRLDRWSSLVGVLSLAAGFLIHGAVIVTRYQDRSGTPVSSLADGLSFMAWLMVGTYLILNQVYRLPAIGACVTPLALTVTMTALLVPTPRGPLEGIQQLSGLPGLAAHVTVAFLGMAAFALAAGVAVMYLVQDRQMKGKKFGWAFSRLPSLEVLDEINRRLVVFGFALLSFTIVTGAYFAKERWGTYWSWDPKETFSLVAWAVFALLIGARLQGGWRGRKVALLTVIGTGILLMSFVGLFAFPVGRHGQMTRSEGRRPLPPIEGRHHG
jgi:cytochrome c-type biogenesis protein CcsB